MFGVQYLAIESNLTLDLRMRRDSTVFSRKSSAFGDNFQTVPWLEARLQHLLARPSIARILFGLTNGEAASQPHRLQAGFFGHFQKTSLILRVPKHMLLPLSGIFLSHLLRFCLVLEAYASRLLASAALLLR